MSRTLDHQQRQQQKQQQKPTVSTTRGQSRRNEGGRKRWSWAETPWEMKHHRLPINENGWENESRPPPMPNAQVEEDMYEAPVDGRREERPVQLDEERQHPAYAIPPSDDVQLVSGGGSQLNQPPQQQRATMWPGTQQQQTQQPLPSTQSPIESTDTTDSKDGKTGAVKPDSKKNTGYNPQYRTYHPDSALLSPHSPGQVRHPIRRPTEDERHWHHGLYDCASDPAVCFTGLFCPCVLYGKTQYRLTQKADKKDATNMLGYKTVNGSCVVMGVFWPLGCLLASVQHIRTRSVYHIAGNPISDCLHALCCCCCALAQDESEIKWREERTTTSTISMSGFQTQAEPYTSPQGMSMTFAAPPKAPTGRG